MLQALRLTPAASKPRTPRAWLVAVVLVVLVCAQALGFMHGAVHGMHPGAADHGLVATPAGSADAHAEAAHDDHGWIGALFSAHEDADDCRVFDGLGSQLAPLMAVPLGMLVLPSADVLRQLDGGFVARWAALFDARGPPLSH